MIYEFNEDPLNSRGWSPFYIKDHHRLHMKGDPSVTDATPHNTGIGNRKGIRHIDYVHNDSLHLKMQLSNHYN